MFCHVAHSLVSSPAVSLLVKTRQHSGPDWAHNLFPGSNPVVKTMRRHHFGIMLASRRPGTGLNAPTGGAS
ncbi:hypothetical protein EKH55_1907 [Sinorhizobium alkalisoli]|nr:hypothetical protein EKH55_1907 [Sinorhizobium alkalisoli]